MRTKTQPSVPAPMSPSRKPGLKRLTLSRATLRNISAAGDYLYAPPTSERCTIETCR